MKKFIATFLTIAMLAIALPFVANAQTSKRYYKNRYKKPSTYQKHKHAIDLGVGAGAGAIIGALTGGKKGALIGAGVGAGAGALYTYVIKPKKKTRRY